MSRDTDRAEPGINEPTGTAAAPPPRRRTWWLFAIAFGVVLIDQVTKAWAIATLADADPITVIDPLLTLTFVRNPGAAFGMGTQFTGVFTVLAATVTIFIVWYARRVRDMWWALALGLILGGALGNFIDRLAQPPGAGSGHVVDFLRIPNWPVFNVADMAVVGGAVLIVVLSLLGRDPDGSTDSGE